MSRNSRKGRQRRTEVEERNSVAIAGMGTHPEDSEVLLARARLRERWELASVLNFLHVFEPVMDNKLKLSAEEIEVALINPNDDLRRIHTAILKGIPPIQRKVVEDESWVTIVSKKLLMWWPWVADGDNPLKPDRGEEIKRYKELDPSIRLLLLKALCEVRAEQDDILRYITDSLKSGTHITTFRKERIGGDGDEVAYWYDGDGFVGHRLYRETLKGNVKRKSTFKGSKFPKVDSQWETLATNLDEFLQISETLSSSKINMEAAVGQTIKYELVPMVERYQKNRERREKRQHGRGSLSIVNPYSDSIGLRYARRERGPVKYTFEDYDRRIEEAIKLSKRRQSSELGTRGDKKTDTLKIDDGKNSNLIDSDDGEGESIKDDNNSNHIEDDDGEDESSNNDKNSDDDSDEDYDAYYSGRTIKQEMEKDQEVGRTGSNKMVGDCKDMIEDKKDEDHNVRRMKGSKLVVHLRCGIDWDGLREEANAHLGAKKRLRQRPTPNSECDLHVISSSKDIISDSEATSM